MRSLVPAPGSSPERGWATSLEGDRLGRAAATASGQLTLSLPGLESVDDEGALASAALELLFPPLPLPPLFFVPAGFAVALAFRAGVDFVVPEELPRDCFVVVVFALPAPATRFPLFACLGLIVCVGLAGWLFRVVFAFALAIDLAFGDACVEVAELFFT